MKGGLIFVFLLLIAVFLMHNSRAVVISPDKIGFIGEIPPYNLTLYSSYLDFTKDVGGKIVRYPIRWYWVERYPSVEGVHTYDFGSKRLNDPATMYDSLFKLNAQKGIETIAIIDDSADWARGTRNSGGTYGWWDFDLKYMEDFKSYVRAAAERYDGDCDWNGDGSCYSRNVYYCPRAATKSDHLAYSLAHVLNLDLAHPPSNPSFPDIPKTHWAYKEIEAVKKAGIMLGNADGTFGANILREDIAVYISRALNLDVAHPPSTPSFTDVPVNSSKYVYIEAVKKAGIMLGYADGIFKPKEIIPRESTAFVIRKSFNLVPSGSGIKFFTDVPLTYSFYNDIDAVYTNNDAKECFSEIEDGTSMPKIRYWEIFNEPNWYWNPTDFSKVMKEAYLTIKSVQPDAIVFMGGITFIWNQTLEEMNSSTAPYASLGYNFSRSVFNEIGTAYTDAYAIHAATYPDSPEKKNLSKIMDQFISMFRSYGLDKKLWITEFGYSTLNSQNCKGLPQYVTEEQQANYFTRSLVIIFSQNYTDVLSSYPIQDGPPGWWEFWECTGFKRLDNTKKPAYYSFKTFMAQLNGASFSSKLSLSSNNYGYKFVNGNKNILVLWNAIGTSSVTVNIGVKEAKQILRDGGETIISTSSGAVTLTLTERPVYLVYGCDNGKNLQGKCDSYCGASSQCNALQPGNCAGSSGFCSSNCIYQACPAGNVCSSGKCQTQAEICNDNIDNDADGKIDCKDSDCPSSITCGLCQFLSCSSSTYDWTCQNSPLNENCGTSQCQEDYCGGSNKNTPYIYPLSCNRSCDGLGFCQFCTCIAVAGTNCGTSKYCSTGSCAQCSSGTANCDENGTNSCEANLNTDKNNCGTCGNVCGTGKVCVSGLCITQTEICNDKIDNNDDGKIDCQDPQCPAQINCSTCTKSVCSASYEWICQNSGTNESCGTSQCPSNYCLGNIPYVYTSKCTKFCSGTGSCNNCSCTAIKQIQCNTESLCSSGVCVQCPSGYANCDLNPASNCEIDLQVDKNNCGTCGNQCDVNHQCSNGVCIDKDNCESIRCGANAYCSHGNCICNFGFNNCDDNWLNGCETSSNCSACLNGQKRECTDYAGCKGEQICLQGEWQSCEYPLKICEPNKVEICSPNFGGLQCNTLNGIKTCNSCGTAYTDCRISPLYECCPEETRSCFEDGCYGTQKCAGVAWQKCKLNEGSCCGINCDDENSCTEDSCSNGKCSHEKIESCNVSVKKDVLIVDQPNNISAGQEFTVIIHDKNGVPVQGVVVLYNEESKITDKQGKVSFIAEQNKEIIAQKEGYITTIQKIVLTTGYSNRKTLILGIVFTILAIIYIIYRMFNDKTKKFNKQKLIEEIARGPIR